MADGSQGTLTVHGGLVGVGGRDGREGWMRHVYSPGQKFDGVLIKSDYALKAGNCVDAMSIILCRALSGI